MSLLTISGVSLVIIGLGLIGLSARYFYLGINALQTEKNLKKVF